MNTQDFLTREMGNTHYAHRSYVSGLNGDSAVLELAVSVEELATPLKIHIYADGTHKINSYSWNSNDAMATANYGKLITLAAGIALKWQAHVEGGTRKVEIKTMLEKIELTKQEVAVIENGLKTSKSQAVKDYRATYDSGLFPTIERVKKVIAMNESESKS